MKHLKLFELYRTDRSRTFTKEVVNKVNRQFVVDLLRNKKVDMNFNIEYIVSYLKNLKINCSHDTITLGSIDGITIESYVVKFKTNPEDLSWGGIYPPKLDLSWEIVFTPLEDEYYIIHYHISKPYIGKDENETVPIKQSYRLGDLWVDGIDSLLPVVKDMIENYDQL